MGNTWIVDLRHFLTPDGTIVDFAGRARAEYFASIVVYATTRADEIVGVRCRRRPRHQRCTGIIVSTLFPDEDERIHWYCPVCDDNGAISGWKNTSWDETGGSVISEAFNGDEPVTMSGGKGSG